MDDETREPGTSDESIQPVTSEETTELATPSEATRPIQAPEEEPIEHMVFQAPVRVSVDERRFVRGQAKTLKRRRFATLETFAQALIPPGGAIEQSASDVGVAERIDAAAASFDPAVRRRLSRTLAVWEWLSVFSRGVRPFSRLPLPVAVGVVERASRTTVAVRRRSFAFLKTLCMNEWASTSPVEQAIGFTYSCVVHESPQEAAALEALGFRDVTRDHAEDCDVVVIGSGAGGSVVAKELAEVGLSVVVLEEGSLFGRDDFAGPPWERSRRLYRAQGTTTAFGRPSIPLPLGKAVGGTTLVNAGSCFRTPDRVLRAWGSEFGIEGIDPEAMRPYFERVEKILHVRPTPEELMGGAGRLFRRGAETLGLHGGPVSRNINGCRGCGVCAYGCPTNALQSTHLTYLPRAQRHGAGILADARAERIVVEDGRARGVEARMIDPATGAPGPKVAVRAKVVVLAAGAIHTPALLQRNAIGGRSGWLGRNLRIHPAVSVTAEFADDTYSWRGTPQPYVIDEWQESHDLMVELKSLTPGIAAGSLPGTGAAVKELAAHMRRFAGAAVYVADTSSGRVRSLGSREPLVTYALNRTDARKLARGVTLTAEVFLAAGAKRVHTGLPGAETVSSRQDLESVKESAVRAGALKPAAFHPAGTARMGAGAATTVVDGWGEAHDVDGLFVTDASALPGCPAVAPMITIMSFATRTADHIIRERERYFA